MPTRTLVGALLWLAAATTAHAQEHVTTLELGEWPDAVAALEADVGAQGRSVSVCVRVERFGIAVSL